MASRFPWRPGFGGAFSYNPIVPVVDVPWFIEQEITGAVSPYAAQSGILYRVQQSTLTSDLRIDLPSLPPVNADRCYVGISIEGESAAGYQVQVYDPNALAEVDRLYVPSETAWYGWDPSHSAWTVLARESPAPDYGKALSPLGAWRFSGADGNVPDLSGGSHILGKASGTVRQNADRYSVATAGDPKYTNANAAFRLTGAVTLEIVCALLGNIGNTGYYPISMGSGSGGAATNRLFSARIVQTSFQSPVALRWEHQHGANTSVFADFPWQLASGFAHYVITRSAPSAGQQSIRAYLNGSSVAAAQNLTAATDGSASTLAVGIDPATGLIALRHVSIYAAELTAAQVQYLARRRLGRA